MVGIGFYDYTETGSGAGFGVTTYKEEDSRGMVPDGKGC